MTGRASIYCVIHSLRTQTMKMNIYPVLNEGARILNPADIFPAAVPSVWRCTSSCHWKFTEENSTKRYSWPRCQEHINSGSLEQFMEEDAKGLHQCASHRRGFSGKKNRPEELEKHLWCYCFIQINTLPSEIQTAGFLRSSKALLEDSFSARPPSSSLP